MSCPRRYLVRCPGLPRRTLTKESTSLFVLRPYRARRERKPSSAGAGRALLAAGALAAPLLGLAAGANAAGAASTPAAAACAADRAAGTMTFVSPFGYDASAGIIDVFAARSLGYFAAECLSVQIIAAAPSPPALVSSGRATVTGEGSAADALLAIGQGAR